MGLIRDIVAHAHYVNIMTNRCKNITLPQTSFVGANNDGKRPMNVR